MFHNVCHVDYQQLIFLTGKHYLSWYFTAFEGETDSDQEQELLLLDLHAFVEQVDELLREVKPSMKKVDTVKHFVQKLQAVILRMKQAKREHQVFRETEILLITLLTRYF